jgi:hypothetical protein
LIRVNKKNKKLNEGNFPSGSRAANGNIWAIFSLAPAFDGAHQKSIGNKSDLRSLS